MVEWYIVSVVKISVMYDHSLQINATLRPVIGPFHPSNKQLGSFAQDRMDET